MSSEPEWTEEQVSEALTWKRQQLSDHEEQWKKLRADSRELTLRLVTQHGVSISRAAELSGHHRQTITIWLKIHNAENKGRPSE